MALPERRIVLASTDPSGKRGAPGSRLRPKAEIRHTVKFIDDADNIRYHARAGQVLVGYVGENVLREAAGRNRALGFADSNRKQGEDSVVDARA